MSYTQEKKIVIANWKMNPRTLDEAKKIFSAIKTHAGTKRDIQTVVCAPFVFLSHLKRLVTGHRCVLGAQDVFWERNGSYTGEISPPMLSENGARYVIVGHSERRALGETNEAVARKTKAVIEEGLTAVVCVGERERDTLGEYFSFVEAELKESFSRIKSKELNQIIIAYEPIWAIGEKAERPATPREFEEMIIFIRKTLADFFGKKHGLSVVILYGGSVDEQNAGLFLSVPNSGGLLVGRASLEPKIFNKILDRATESLLL